MRTMCVSINGSPLVTLTIDLLTLKLVCESHLRWGTFLLNLGTLSLWLLELFAMYATNEHTDRPTDGQTNGRTDGQKQLYLPLPYRQGIKNGCLLIFVTNSMIFFSFICNSKRLVAGLHQNPLGELQNVISMISFKGTSSPD